MNGSSRNPYLVTLLLNHHVEINGCTLDANNVTYDSIYCRCTHCYVYNTGLYNALQGLEVFMGWAFMQNTKGSCSWSMVSYAGYIIASGTVPEGSRGYGNNGQLWASNVTVDTGTAISSVNPDSTTTQYATLTKSYRGGWRSDTVDVIQGVYSDYGYSSGLSWNYGCMWFGNLKSTLSGKTIKSATLTLHRKTGSGSGSAKTLYLCAISNTSASGTPSISVNYGAIGTIGRDESLSSSSRLMNYEMIRKYYNQCVSLCKKNNYNEKILQNISEPYLSFTITCLKLKARQKKSIMVKRSELNVILKDNQLHEVLKMRNLNNENKAKQILYKAILANNYLLARVLIYMQAYRSKR